MANKDLIFSDFEDMSALSSVERMGSAQVSDFLGHRLADRAFISADLLQANSADDLDKFRVPTTMVSEVMI